MGSDWEGKLNKYPNYAFAEIFQCSPAKHNCTEEQNKTKVRNAFTESSKRGGMVIRKLVKGSRNFSIKDRLFLLNWNVTMNSTQVQYNISDGFLFSTQKHSTPVVIMMTFKHIPHDYALPFMLLSSSVSTSIHLWAISYF